VEPYLIYSQTSERGDVLYSILIVLGVAMELVGLIKMCLNERYGKS
jgi:hypothetical protein